MFAFALLALAAAPGGPVVYKGFVNTPLGAAVLTVDAGGNTMTASNIGSSGLDGFAINVSNPPTFEVQIVLPDAGTAAFGSWVETVAVGVLSGVPNRVLWTMRIEDVGTEYALTVDPSPLAPQSLNVASGATDTVSDFFAYQPPPAPGTVLATFPEGALRIQPGLGFPSAPSSVIRFDAPVLVTIPNGVLQGGPWPATVLSVAGLQPAQTAGAVSRYELRTSDTVSILVVDEDLTLDCMGGGLGNVYCTAKASSSGCLARMGPDPESACGDPTSGQTDYALAASGVQGFRNGIQFGAFSSPAAIPFQGGTLCITPPLARTPVQNSLGTSPVSCDGTFSLIINDGGTLDAGPGGTAFVQAWYRDTQLGDGFNTALSDAYIVNFQ